MNIYNFNNGVLGSTIVLTVTLSTTNLKLFTVALDIFFIGETLVAYSDGMFDNPYYIDWKFFVADSSLAVIEPFLGGGLKVVHKL